MIFTRLLYCYDEVKINLLLSILKKDMRESVFWFMELYGSGYKNNLIKFLWEIYYDFFALQTNFSLIKYKNDIQKYNAKENVVLLINFINKLCQSTYSFDVFITRMFFKDGQNTVSSKNYEPLLQLLFKSNKVEMYYKYLKLGLNYTTKEKLIKIVDKIRGKKFKENIMYSDLSHQLFVYTFSSNVRVRKSLKGVKKNIINYSKYCKTFDCQTTQTLQTYRDYEISNLTSCFSLQREELEKPLTEYFWYNWLYYASKSPYWKSKLDDYEYIIDKETKEVLFKTEDYYEDFHERYSYDLDELDFDTRNKSTKILVHHYNLRDLLLILDEKKKLILNISKKIDTIKNKY
jgi:hypothetical protein